MARFSRGHWRLDSSFDEGGAAFLNLCFEHQMCFDSLLAAVAVIVVIQSDNTAVLVQLEE
jgi:hypothetical protein